MTNYTYVLTRDEFHKQFVVERDTGKVGTREVVARFPFAFEHAARVAFDALEEERRAEARREREEQESKLAASRPLKLGRYPFKDAFRNARDLVSINFPPEARFGMFSRDGGRRVRDFTTRALAYILQQRPLDEVEDYLRRKHEDCAAAGHREVYDTAVREEVYCFLDRFVARRYTRQIEAA